jgi:hypothetical protein
MARAHAEENPRRDIRCCVEMFRLHVFAWERRSRPNGCHFRKFGVICRNRDRDGRIADVVAVNFDPNPGRVGNNLNCLRCRRSRLGRKDWGRRLARE